MNPNQAMSRLIKKIARRLNFAIWLNGVLSPCGVALISFAVALLCCKLIRPDWMLWTPAILAAIPAIFFYGWIAARRQGAFFQRTDVIEVIDHLYLDDGSVSTAEENPKLLPVERLHEEVIRSVSARIPRLKPAHFSRKLTPAVLLITVALVFPARKPAASPQAQEILTALSDPLFEKLKEHEEVLPEEARKELEEAAEVLKQDEQGISREKWEAVEELDRRIEEAARRSEQSLAAALASLNQAAQLQAQGNITGDPGSQQMDKLLSDLGKSLADSKNGLPQGLKKEIRDVMKQMKAMDNAELRKKLAALQKKMSCCKSGTCNGNCNGNCSGTGQCKPGNRPGKGGITRGRADAELSGIL